MKQSAFTPTFIITSVAFALVAALTIVTSGGSYARTHADSRVAAVSPGSETAKTVKIRWFGQAGFLITTAQGTRIVIDPANFKGYKMPEGVTADILTVSHEHMDHNAVETVGGNPAVFRGTDRDCSTVHTIDTTVGPVRLYTVPSYHDPGHHGVNAIFVFEFDGLRLAHLGDIGEVLTSEQIDALGQIDILMIPVGGKYTISHVEADSIVNQLNPKRLVFPMHYKTAAFDGLPYTAEPFLADKPNVTRLETNEFVFKPAAIASELEYVLMRY